MGGQRGVKVGAAQRDRIGGADRRAEPNDTSVRVVAHIDLVRRENGRRRFVAIVDRDGGNAVVGVDGVARQCLVHLHVFGRTEHADRQQSLLERPVAELAIGDGAQRIQHRICMRGPSACGEQQRSEFHPNASCHVRSPAMAKFRCRENISVRGSR